MEYLKVKEWKEKAGISLYNYDGFVDDYDSITQNNNYSFSNNVISRFQSAGELICSRKYFESKLPMCTINISSYEEYEVMVKTIPNFVDFMVNGALICDHIALKNNHKIDKKQKFSDRIKNIFKSKESNYINNDDIKIIEEIIKLLKIKEEARQRSRFFAKLTDNECTVRLETEDLNKEELKKQKKYIGTNEIDIYSKLINILENLTKKDKKHKISEMPFDLFEVYNILSRKRSFLVSKISKEELGDLYIIPTKQNETENFVKTFRSISPDGIDNGVVFKYSDDNQSTITGTIPISEETKNKIDEKKDNGTIRM